MTFIKQLQKPLEEYQTIKITSTDTTKNLRMKCLVQLIDLNVRPFF